MGRSRRIGRGETPAPWLAALAMLALVVQLLIPAAAMAQSQSAAMVICTAEGAVSVAADADGGPAKGFAGLSCQDCVTASIAALPAPQPLAVPVSYAVRAAPVLEIAPAAQPRARAPPRPPSQGPPVQTEA